MKDAKKTKDQLINELEKLRRRVRSLEKKDAERKQLLSALKESEFKYFTLVDQAEDIVVIIQDGLCKFANRAIEVSGYRVEELAGKHFEKIVVPHQREELKQRHRDRRANKRVPLAYEATMLCKDGSTLDFEVSATHIQYEGADAVLGIGRNITQRMRSEAALRESEAKYAAVVEQASDLVVILQDGVIEFANPAIKEFGFTQEEIVGVPFVEMLAPAEQQHMSDLHRAHMEGQDVPSVYETSLVDKLGKSFDLEVAVDLIQYRGRTAVLAIARNVTERKRSETALKESEAKYSAVVEHAQDTVIVVQDGMVKFVNPAIERFGFTKEEVVDRPYLDLLAPESAEGVKVRHEQRISGKQVPPLYESRLLAKDGRIMDVDVSATIIQYEGHPAVLAIVRDVTERRHAEEERRKLQAQMQHAQKLESLGVLAGGIAHDFNNLLMGVLGNASLALLELPDWSRARPHVEKIEKASQHAAELTKQMLAYSGKGKFLVQDIEISELVEEMTDLLKVSISKKAALNYQFERDLPPIEADATQIRQVIMNLITNASDAIADKSGVITISTGSMEADRDYLAQTYLDEDLPAGRYVFLEVSDTGSGMDADTQSRIFDPFFSSKFTGRGLGLAAVLGIVRGHHGAISVYSEPGKGTTFKVLFPVKEWVAQPEAEETEESWAPATGKTILVVDDEATVRDVAKNMLESFDFKVLLAKDGQEGVEVFRQNQDQIAAVLLDYTMPTMDGVETFLELRRVQPGVRVILSSGYNELDATHRFTGKGLAGFIQKPYRLSQLVDKVREVLEKK